MHLIPRSLKRLPILVTLAVFSVGCAVVYIDPPAKTISHGETGSVDVKVDVGTESEVEEMTVHVAYDPAIVRLESCTERVAGADCQPPLTPNTARITFDRSLVGPTPTGDDQEDLSQSETYRLASLRFAGRGLGTTPLEVTATDCNVDTSPGALDECEPFEADTEDGSITVVEPTPTTDTETVVQQPTSVPPTATPLPTATPTPTPPSVRGSQDYYNGEPPKPADEAPRLLLCDWDGDGVRTIGWVHGNTWAIHTDGGIYTPAEIVFTYGLAGDVPICGDWDGNGTTTVGYVRAGYFYIRNSNTSGEPHDSIRVPTPTQPVPPLP